MAILKGYYEILLAIINIREIWNHFQQLFCSLHKLTMQDERDAVHEEHDFFLQTLSGVRKLSHITKPEN